MPQLQWPVQWVSGAQIMCLRFLEDKCPFSVQYFREKHLPESHTPSLLFLNTRVVRKFLLQNICVPKKTGIPDFTKHLQLYISTYSKDTPQSYTQTWHSQKNHSCKDKLSLRHSVLMAFLVTLASLSQDGTAWHLTVTTAQLGRSNESDAQCFRGWRSFPPCSCICFRHSESSHPASICNSDCFKTKWKILDNLCAQSVWEIKIYTKAKAMTWVLVVKVIEVGGKG